MPLAIASASSSSLKRRHGDERPEDFFLADPIVRIGAHHGGLDVVALGKRRIDRAHVRQ